MSLRSCNHCLVLLACAALLCFSAKSDSPFREWQQRYPSPSFLNGVAFGNNTFVAVERDGVGIFSSTNGVDWAQEKPSFAHRLNAVIYGAGRFVAFGATSDGRADVVLVSTDGRKWNEYTLARIGFVSAAFGNGIFVGVGDRDVYTSPDGINWTRGGIDGGWGISKITYGNGKFVASGGSGLVSTSIDGLHWSPLKRISDDKLNLYCLTFGNGVFVGAGDGSAVWRSEDGENWTGQRIREGLDTGAAFLGLGYGNGLFVLSGSTYGGGNSVFYTSSDGLKWTGRTSPNSPLNLPTTIDIRGTISYGNGIFVGTGHGIVTSPDGLNWTAIKLPTGFGVLFAGVTHRKDTFLAVGNEWGSLWESIIVARSLDGSSWDVYRVEQNYRLNDVASDEHTFVAVGGASYKYDRSPTTILSSADGINWTERLIDSGPQLNAVIQAKGLFITVGDGGRIYSSADGNRWTKQESGIAEDLVAVAYGNGTFVAVGGQRYGLGYYTKSMILTSTNGVTWARANFPTGNILLGVTFGSGTFLAARWYGPYLTSTNGTDWTSHELEGAPRPNVTFIGVSRANFAGGWFVVSAGDRNWIWSNWISSDLSSWTLSGAPSAKWASAGKNFVSVSGLNIWQSELAQRLYEVSVSSNGFASEAGEEAKFTIRRRGPTTIGLPVQLSISGTAENGSDYEFINTTAVIEAGRDAVEIPLRPRRDSLVEEAETVVLQIVPGDAYDVAPPGSATVWIEDAGLAPRIRPSQIVRQSDGIVQLVIETPMTGRYAVEASADLKNWQAVQTITTTNSTVEMKDATAGQPRRFYRAKFLGP